MMYLLLAAGVVIGSLLLLFLLWIIVTGLQRANDAQLLAPEIVVLGKIIYFCAYAWDVWCNVVCTVVFLQLPREFTVSERLRMLVTTTGWRRSLAVWFATRLINPFSNGGPHIEIPQ